MDWERIISFLIFLCCTIFFVKFVNNLILWHREKSYRKKNKETLEALTHALMQLQALRETSLAATSVNTLRNVQVQIITYLISITKHLMERTR